MTERVIKIHAAEGGADSRLFVAELGTGYRDFCARRG